MARKINYLNNKDILKEIHKSKSTFCSFISDADHQFDIILLDIEKINIRTVAEAKRNQAKRMQHIDFDARKLAGQKIKLAECEVDYRKVKKTDLIFRIMTFDHIPDEPGRKKTPKTVADHKVKLNFPPFKHYRFDEEDNLICVGKSHWTGGMENVRGYTYNDEMRGQAILQLAQIGLQFDESKSDNPFAYYTAAVTNSFVRVINIEKRAQNIRDDILEMNDMNPSYTRQNAGEWEAQQKREKDFQTKK